MTKYVLSGIIVFAIFVSAFFFLRRPVIAPDISVPPTSVSTSPSSEDSFEKGNIIVTSPHAQEQVGNPIIITGRARVFESAFVYQLKDASGNIIYTNYGLANAPDIGQFGNFEVKIPIPSGASSNLTVEVFSNSAKDGSIINLVSIPVTVKDIATTKVSAYFGNSQFTTNLNACDKNYTVPRQVFKTTEVGYLALSELLRGPTEQEKSQGYFSSIPTEAKLKSLKIQNGIAYADFDEGLQYGVAGSCRVTAIGSQIINTLRQFPTIKKVVISISGQTEGILQP